MFALMDRNELEVSVKVESSQSSKGSRDYLAENVDVIRLHSVVQGFFIDILNKSECLDAYLYRAVLVFCKSYNKAIERIATRPSEARVGDFWLYDIHGKRLLTNVLKYEKRYPRLHGELT